MDHSRIESSININIDLYLEELKREQASRDKQNAERDRSENDRSGNGAVSLDDRGGAGGEEDWEEEYVMLDLDDVFHGAPVPNFAYTLSGLDTLNPTLTFDNGLKLIGHYVETIGTVVVYSEKEKEAQADRWELPPPADPNAVIREKRPLKRIRGVCKLERKLKFCAMPIAYAPARHDPSADDTSLGNAVQTRGVVPTDNASRPTVDAPLESALSTRDAVPSNDVLKNNASVESAKLGKDVSLSESIGPVNDASLENARLMEDAPLENARPARDASLG